MRHVSLFFLLVAITAAFSTTAAAQSSDGRFQLGLTTALVAYTTQTLSNEDSDEDVDISSTSWGIGQGAALELGYGIGEMIVLGAVASLHGASRTIDADGLEQEQESTTLTIAFGPKIDVLFSPDSAVRPFVGAVVALAHSSEETAGGSETSLTGPELHGRLGLHWFATESFSLSPSLDLSYATGSGEISVGTQDIELTTSGFSVMLALGLSGWIE